MHPSTNDDLFTFLLFLIRRDEVVEEIEAAGATYSKTVTKKVTHLVVADPNSTSQKVCHSVLIAC